MVQHNPVMFSQSYIFIPQQSQCNWITLHIWNMSIKALWAQELDNNSKRMLPPSAHIQVPCRLCYSRHQKASKKLFTLDSCAPSGSEHGWQLHQGFGSLQASAAVSATHHLSRNISKDIWDVLHTSSDLLQTGAHRTLHIAGVVR